MRGVALWPLGLQNAGDEQQPTARLDRQCIVWLEVLTTTAPESSGEAAVRRTRARCPYEAACRDRGRCFLPHHPRC
jgi:hypothetical protein